MQISDSELKTPRGKVLGIGRVKIPKMFLFNKEIPLLSFVVIKKEDGKYISTCIHLQIDGYGDSVIAARIDMVSKIWYFLYENFNNRECMKKSWINILDLFKSNERSNILWDKYHAFQIMLAERDVATDKYSQLQKKIESLQDKVNKLQKEIKKLKDDEKRKYISDKITDSFKLKRDMIVEYKNLEHKKAA